MCSDSMFSAENREMREEECDIYKGKCTEAEVTLRSEIISNGNMTHVMHNKCFLDNLSVVCTIHGSLSKLSSIGF